LLSRYQQLGGHVQQLNNQGKLSGDAQKGFVGTALLCAVPKIAVSLLEKRSISVTSLDGGILE